MTPRRRVQVAIVGCWLTFALALLTAISSASDEPPRWWLVLANLGLMAINLELIAQNRRTLRAIDANL